MGRETRIDERAQVFADSLASMPIGNTEVPTASSVKQSKPFPKVLSSISFQKANSH